MFTIIFDNARSREVSLLLSWLRWPLDSPSILAGIVSPLAVCHHNVPCRSVCVQTLFLRCCDLLFHHLRLARQAQKHVGGHKIALAIDGRVVLWISSNGLKETDPTIDIYADILGENRIMLPFEDIAYRIGTNSTVDTRPWAPGESLFIIRFPSALQRCWVWKKGNL